MSKLRSRWWRGPAGLSFRQCARTSVGPAAVALAIAIIANANAQPELVGNSPAAAASPWLTLPLFVIAISSCLTAARIWPTFALRQPGADTVRRLERGLLGGRGAVICGALGSQLCLSVPTILLLSMWLGAPEYARHHYQTVGPAEPILAGIGGSVTFTLPNGPKIQSIWLRPRAALPVAPGATELKITTNDEQIATTPIAISESGALLRVQIAEQRLSRFTLTQTAGGIPLYFAENTVIAVGPADLPTWCNALFVAVIAALTSAITLTIAAVVGLGAGWATLATTICCAQFVQWIGGSGPIGDALISLMRGQWLL